MTQNSSEPEAFNPPENMVPSKPGGSWDEAGKADVDSYERDAWKEDSDEADRAAATDFDKDEPEVGDEQVADPAIEEQTEEPEQVEAAEDAPGDEDPVLTPRANDRIRQLVDDRNAERQRALALEQRMEALLAIQQRQAELQERLYAEGAAKQQAQQAQDKQTQFVNQLKQYGYNDGDVAHVLSLQALEQAQQANKRMQEIETDRQQQTFRAQVRAYESALATELDKSLTDPKSGKALVNSGVKTALYQAAHALARDKQIADPSEAVKQVVAPILSEIRAVAKTTKRPQPSDPVHKVISTQGRAAGKSPGTRAGQKTLAKDVLAFLK